MSSWTSFYIKTPDIDTVTEQLKQLSGIATVTEGGFPSTFHDSYLINESLPNYLVIGKTQPDWVTINYNSSNKLAGWCKKISKELNTSVLVTLAQSVSSYYYFAFYENGQKLREIEYCYSEDFDEVDFGSKFSFEHEQPGQRTEYDGRVEYLFDFHSIEAYCNYFGLAIQTDYDTVAWKILKGGSRGKTVRDFLAGYKKPWWKFWR